jgi:hypothetical protein
MKDETKLRINARFLLVWSIFCIFASAIWNIMYFIPGVVCIFFAMLSESEANVLFWEEFHRKEKKLVSD